VPNPAIYPIHLCQPDARKSCGACCGLFNYQDHSRATLQHLLRKRAEFFEKFGREDRAEEYRKRTKAVVSSPKLVENIYNCEFLGFLDKEERRVGCLLHPAKNKGEDLRNNSFYGADLCAGHLCPSYTYLTVIEQKAVVAVLDDWYLYGLVITDIDLVKEFFRHAQTRLGDSIHPDRLEKDAVKNSLRDFFALKENWPFASTDNRLGKYYFSHSEYQIARIEYEKEWKIKPSRFDKILISLSSEFSALDEVRRAEELIEEKIRNFLDAYQGDGERPFRSTIS
jgi:hypothetical protein